jgi:hypothetical protein
VNATLQYLIVALIVVPSAVYAVGVFSPQLKRRMQRRVALWLLAPQRSQVLRRYGLNLMPPEQASGCGAGCSDCNNCAPPAANAEQPLIDLRVPRR